jgi:flagellar motor switch protein FliN
MRWESLEWRPVDADTPAGTAVLADLVPMARSASDEAVSAVVMGPVTTTGLSIALTTGAELPDGFVPVATFELLGTPRRGVWVALDPAAGARLGASEVTATGLASAIVEALDAVLVEAVGEGLSAAPTGTLEPDPSAELALFRLALSDADGTEAALVVAVEAMVPVELATHVAALRALGPAASSPPPVSAPATTSRAGSEPVAVNGRPPADANARTSGSPVASPPIGTNQPDATTSIRPFVLDELPPASAVATNQNIELLMGVHLEVTVEIGRTRLAIRDVLSLSPGSIVELDKLAGEKVDVLVNGQPIAQGEVVVVDENFGVRITDVVSRQRRILSADGAA